MEEPQPEATPSAGADQSAQPIASDQPVAEQPQAPPEPEAPLDDTADWLSKKGFDPSDPEFATKIAKSYREAEKLAMQATRKASELEKSLNTNQQQTSSMDDFIADYRREKMISSFAESTPDWQQYEDRMSNLLKEQINTPYGEFSRGELVNEGILSLHDIYAMAKGSTPVNTEEIKRNAQNEVLQTLANTQRAGSSIANASNSIPNAEKPDPIMEAIRKSRGN